MSYISCNRLLSSSSECSNSTLAIFQDIADVLVISLQIILFSQMWTKRFDVAVSVALAGDVFLPFVSLFVHLFFSYYAVFEWRIKLSILSDWECQSVCPRIRCFCIRWLQQQLASYSVLKTSVWLMRRLASIEGLVGWNWAAVTSLYCRCGVVSTAARWYVDIGTKARIATRPGATSQAQGPARSSTWSPGHHCRQHVASTTSLPATRRPQRRRSV